MWIASKSHPKYFVTCNWSLWIFIYLQSNLCIRSPLLSSHLYLKVTIFLSFHRKFHMNWTSYDVTCLIRTLLLCINGDLLIQVWLIYFACMYLKQVVVFDLHCTIASGRPIWLKLGFFIVFFGGDSLMSNNYPFGVISGFIFSTNQSVMTLLYRTKCMPRAVMWLVNTLFYYLAYDWTVKDKWKVTRHGLPIERFRLWSV